jgi:O-antigen/teichoic acid export membrane protein/SAM-dependent methyltransferase
MQDYRAGEPMNSPYLAQIEPTTERDGLFFSEQVRLTRDGLLNISVYAVTAVAGMVLVPALLFRLSREMYGLWIAALAMQYSFAFLSGGLGRCVAREVAIGDRGDSNHFLAAASAAYLMLGVIGAVAIALAGLPLATGLHVSAQSVGTAHFIFALAGIGFLADQVQSLSFEVLTGLRRFPIISSLSNGSVLLRTGGIILLLKSGGAIVAVALWHVAVCVATAAVAYALAARFAPLVRPQQVSLRWSEIREQLRFSLAGQLAAGATSVLWRSAPFLLGFLKGAPAIVPYELGGKFPMSVSSISWQAAEVFFPAATEYHSAKKEEHTRQLLRIGTRGVLLFVAPLCVSLFILASDLLKAWVGIASSEPAWTLRLITAAVLIDSAAAASIQIIWGQGKINFASKLTVASAALAAISTCALIPRFGAAGAATGLLAGVVLSSAGFIYFASRSCHENAWRLLLETAKDLAIPLVLMAAFLFGAGLLDSHAGWLSLVLRASGGFAVYIVACYLFAARSVEKTIVGGVLSSVKGRLYSLYQSVRRILERNTRIRTAILYAVEIKNALLDSSKRDRSAVERMFSRQQDPFGFNRGLERFRFQRAMEILESGADGTRFPRALEIGCAEGDFTKLLADRCETLVAVDLSKIALDRARERCSEFSNVQFAEWDVRQDPVNGPFDLIVATGVLEYILRPSTLKDVRERITAALRPGGFLLLGNTATDNGVEKTLIGKKLIRGTLVNDFFAADPRYEVLNSSVDQCVCMFAHMLLRKRLN